MATLHTMIQTCRNAAPALVRSAQRIFPPIVATETRPALHHRLLSSGSSSSSSSTTTQEVPFYGLPRPPSDLLNHSTSLVQRLAVAVRSATTAFADPTQADAVAALAEVTGHVALTDMHHRMTNDAVGQRILRDRPTVSKSSLPIDELIQSARNEQQLQDKPDGDNNNNISFGQAYGAFLLQHGFDPDERSQVKYVDDPELAYVMLRYRQCHDYWHVLTGLPPTVLGELGLKWLELLQTGLPVAALSATVGSLRLPAHERRVLMQHYLPWAVRNSTSGDTTTYLLNVYYEEEFETPLEELRTRLGIEPAPAVDISN